MAGVLPIEDCLLGRATRHDGDRFAARIDHPIPRSRVCSGRDQHGISITCNFNRLLDGGVLAWHLVNPITYTATFVRKAIAVRVITCERHAYATPIYPWPMGLVGRIAANRRLRNPGITVGLGLHSTAIVHGGIVRDRALTQRRIAARIAEDTRAGLGCLIGRNRAVGESGTALTAKDPAAVVHGEVILNHATRQRRVAVIEIGPTAVAVCCFADEVA